MKNKNKKVKINIFYLKNYNINTYNSIYLKYLAQ